MIGDELVECGVVGHELVHSLVWNEISKRWTKNHNWHQHRSQQSTLCHFHSFQLSLPVYPSSNHHLVRHTLTIPQKIQEARGFGSHYHFDQSRHFPENQMNGSAENILLGHCLVNLLEHFSSTPFCMQNSQNLHHSACFQHKESTFLY